MRVSVPLSDHIYWGESKNGAGDGTILVAIGAGITCYRLVLFLMWPPIWPPNLFARRSGSGLAPSRERWFSLQHSYPFGRFVFGSVFSCFLSIAGEWSRAAAKIMGPPLAPSPSQCQCGSLQLLLSEHVGATRSYPICAYRLASASPRNGDYARRSAILAASKASRHFYIYR